MDRWEQQVFFIRKNFPHAERRVVQLRKEHEKKCGKADFAPSEELLTQLVDLYAELSAGMPKATPASSMMGGNPVAPMAPASSGLTATLF